MKKIYKSDAGYTIGMSYRVPDTKVTKLIRLGRYETYHTSDAGEQSFIEGSSYFKAGLVRVWNPSRAELSGESLELSGESGNGVESLSRLDVDGGEGGSELSRESLELSGEKRAAEGMVVRNASTLQGAAEILYKDYGVEAPGETREEILASAAAVGVRFPKLG